MGTAHAGHDQCAHCYFQYIKPALQAERAAVKRRKELKRLHLSPENRALISEVDLKEPQMVDRLPPPKPISIQRAVSDVLIDKMLAGKTEEQQLETIFTEMIKEETAGLLPPDIRPVQPVKSTPKEEPPVQNTTPEPEPLTRHVHAGGSGSRLTEAQVKEVIDAYQDGMVVNAICDVCNIATTTLYAIVREYGIPFRTGRTRPILTSPPRPTPAVVADVQRRFPPPPRRRPSVMAQSTPPVSPPKVEPAPSNGVVSGLTEWVVTYTVTRTETTIVAARDFNNAAAAAVSATGGEIISVAKKLP